MPRAAKRFLTPFPLSKNRCFRSMLSTSLNHFEGWLYRFRFMPVIIRDVRFYSCLNSVCF